MRSADELKVFLAAQGVDLSLVRETAERPYRNRDHHACQCRQHHRRHSRRQRLVSAADVAARSFSAKGDIAVSQFEIPLPAITAFFKRARAAGATTILNPAPAIEFGRRLLDLVDILILNESELGLLDQDRASRYRRSRALHRGGADRCRPATDRIICVTLGKRGVLALVDGEPLMMPGRAVKAVDTTGAGDCFVGARGGATRGRQIRFAMRWAMPMPPRRSACSGWAPRRRCRRRQRWRQLDDRLSQRRLQIEAGIRRLLRRRSSRFDAEHAGGRTCDRRRG